jgi:hypothetical protein
MQLALRVKGRIHYVPDSLKVDSIPLAALSDYGHSSSMGYSYRHFRSPDRTIYIVFGSIGTGGLCDWAFKLSNSGNSFKPLPINVNMPTIPERYCETE